MTLEPFIKEVCREFNMKPIPSTQEWEAASKLCKLSKPLREMSVFFEGEEVPDTMQYFKADNYIR